VQPNSLATANGRAGTLGYMPSKRSLGVDNNDVLRELARKVLHDRYGDNQAKMARAMGVSAAAVNDFLASKRGAGFAVIKGLQAVTGKSKAVVRQFELGR